MKSILCPKAVGAALALICFSTRLGAAEMAFQILNEFFPAESEPRFPSGRLIQAADGSFYGTDGYRWIGAGGYYPGRIFKVTAQGTVTIVNPFDGLPLYGDFRGLVQTANGDFYGIASGPNQPDSYGTLYRFKTNGSFTPLFSADENDGVRLQGPLADDGLGSFYGTSLQGGIHGLGSIFRISTNGVFQLLVSFQGANGAIPYGALTFGPDGHLYGTTTYGGSNFVGSWTGYGTVFKCTTNGVLMTLVYFNVTNGATPFVGITWADGKFYGTTKFGGENSMHGTIFSLTTNGTLATLASFAGTNGSHPLSGVTRAPNGKLYGVTTDRVDGTNWTFGTICSLDTNGTLTTLARFDGTNASNPFAEMTLGDDGNLYGVACDEAVNLSLNGNAGLFFRLAQVPEITATILTNGVAWLQWTSFTNGVYRVEANTNFNSPSWTPISSDLNATSNHLSFAAPTMGLRQRYYRVRLLP